MLKRQWKNLTVTLTGKEVLKLETQKHILYWQPSLPTIWGVYWAKNPRKSNDIAIAKPQDFWIDNGIRQADLYDPAYVTTSLSITVKIP
jgi:hypothetical protein